MNQEHSVIEEGEEEGRDQADDAVAEAVVRDPDDVVAGGGGVGGGGAIGLKFADGFPVEFGAGSALLVEGFVASEAGEEVGGRVVRGGRAEGGGLEAAEAGSVVEIGREEATENLVSWLR